MSPAANLPCPWPDSPGWAPRTYPARHGGALVGRLAFGFVSPSPYRFNRVGGTCPAHLGVEPWFTSGYYLLLCSGATGLADLLHGQVVGIGQLDCACGFTPRPRPLPLTALPLWAPRPWLALVLLSSRRVALASRSWLAWAPASTRSSASRLAPASRFWLPGPLPSVRSSSFCFAPAPRLSQLARLAPAPCASLRRRAHGSSWLSATAHRAHLRASGPDGRRASGSLRPSASTLTWSSRFCLAPAPQI